MFFLPPVELLMNFRFRYDTFTKPEIGGVMNFQHYFKARRGEMVQLLKKLVDLESPSTDKKAVDACTAFAAKEFRKVGAKVTRYPQEDIGDLYVSVYPAKPNKSQTEQILLLTHLDTVWEVGKIKTMPFYVSGDQVFGPGVLDMKAGVVMALSSLKALNELNIQTEHKIVLFMNSAEEIQSDASTKLIKQLARKSHSVLCLEPSLPGGALKVQRKGRLVVRLECRGKAAHAGHPEKGVNAIDELLTHLQRLKKLTTKQTTMNIGLIGGGEKANIVAEQAWAVLDFRFWKGLEKDRIIDTIKRLKPRKSEARLRYVFESLTPPMEKTQASVALLSRARKIAASLKMEMPAGKTGGGSDASIASSIGTATLDGLGPDGEGIHAENEHLLLSSLIKRTALLTELLCQL